MAPWPGGAISIHAPLAGRDRRPVFDIVVKPQFQSTRPLRGATYTRTEYQGRIRISIHAPLAGRDAAKSRAMPFADVFQSTRPSRGATVSGSSTSASNADFNPRAPHGARHTQSGPPWSPGHFNPRAPHGARQQKYTNYVTHFCEKRQGFNYFCKKRRLSKRFSACR